LVNFFRNLLKYYPVVMIFAVITVLLIYEFMIRDYQPNYEASTSLLVSRTKDEAFSYESYVMLQEVQIAERIVNDIPEMIISNQVRNTVNETLREKLPGSMLYDDTSFRNNVETIIVRQSRVLNISVQHSDPEGARLVAETIAQKTKQMMEEIAGEDFIQVISTAERPQAIAGIGPAHLWVLSLLGGIILGMGVVLILTIAEKYPKPSLTVRIPGTSTLQSYWEKGKTYWENYKTMK